MKKPMTDTRRLNWLSKQIDFAVRDVRSHGDADSLESVQYRAGMRVNLFTIPSQWVYGRDLRDAIDAAMRKAGGN